MYRGGDHHRPQRTKEFMMKETKLVDVVIQYQRDCFITKNGHSTKKPFLKDSKFVGFYSGANNRWASFRMPIELFDELKIKNPLKRLIDQDKAYMEEAQYAT
jgi:hypothetical protein